MAKRYGKLLFLGLSVCSCRGAASAQAVAAAGDSSVLVQESLRLRRRAEAEEDQPLDVDGCPADRDFVEALQASAPRSCDGPSGSLGRAARRNDCAISVRRRVEGEEKIKEVYFMRHAEPNCCVDCGLDSVGIKQCKGLKVNNTLLNEGPLSSDPDKRAQVIYVSPATRTLETAVRIFGDTDIPMVIDFRLVETFGYNPYGQCKWCIWNMLQENNRTDLMSQFTEKLEDPGFVSMSNQDPNTRISKFTRHLQKFPEDRIVVVSHHILMDSFQLGMRCMRMGETVVKFGLSPDGWHSMSPGSCDHRRRRWPYGNFQRRVDAGVDSEDDDGEDLEVAEEHEEVGSA